MAGGYSTSIRVGSTTSQVEPSSAFIARFESATFLVRRATSALSGELIFACRSADMDVQVDDFDVESSEILVNIVHVDDWAG
jgi:hypothetical protein